MRRHGEYELWQRWPQSHRDLLDAAGLVAARAEPVIVRERTAVALDAVFARDGRIFVVPGIIATVEQIFLPHGRPIIWPSSAVAGMSDSRIEPLEDRLTEWLRAEHLAGPVLSERTRIFEDSFAGTFAEAVRYGFAGATRLEEVLRVAAPALYARRFAASRLVICDASVSAFGAMLMADKAIAVRYLDDDAARLDAALRWYPGLRAYDDEAPLRPDVIVGEASTATRFTAAASPNVWVVRSDQDDIAARAGIPFDEALGFEPGIGRKVASLGVSGGAQITLRPVALRPLDDRPGDSGGTLLFVVRADAAVAPDADIEAAHAVAEALRLAGFTVIVSSDPSDVERRPDLVHGFGVEAENVRTALDRAAALGIPTVCTAEIEDLAAGAVWGMTAADASVRFARDEGEFAWYLRMLREGRLAVGTIRSDRRSPPSVDFEARVTSTLGAVDVVIVATEAERALVRERFGRVRDVVLAGPVVEPRPLEAETVGKLVGDVDFALVHSPLDVRANAIAAVRSAQKLDIPLVVAGAPADRVSAATIRSFGSRVVMLVGEPDPRTMTALYARARVYVDLSWAPRGLSRIARALLSGSSAVVSSRTHAAELSEAGAVPVDPRDAEAIATAIGDAWYAAGDPKRVSLAIAKLGERCDLRRNVVLITNAYRTAAGVRAR